MAWVVLIGCGLWFWVWSGCRVNDRWLLAFFIWAGITASWYTRYPALLALGGMAAYIGLMGRFHQAQTRIWGVIAATALIQVYHMSWLYVAEGGYRYLYCGSIMSNHRAGFLALSLPAFLGQVDAALLTLGAQVTDSNAAFFDAANGYAGCIAGIHEVLRRQGLMAGRWCLDPEERLSPGQVEEIDRVYRAYPHLNDDAFVAERLDAFLS